MTRFTEVPSGAGDPSELKIGIAVSAFNGSITEPLAAGARSELASIGVGEVVSLTVPGALELAVAASALASAGCDAVVAVGAVVEGDTDHYDVVVQSSARGLTAVAIRSDVPVTNAVLAVRDVKHAVDRSREGPGNKGAEAARAAVETALALRAVRDPASSS